MSTTRVTPIKEVADMAADAPIFFLQGKLIYVSQPMSGTNEYGEWKFQTVEIQDPSGKINVKLKGRKDGEDIPPAWKGKEVIFENIKTDQGGWKSLTAFDDEHKGKTTRKVKATACCAIYLAGDASRQQPTSQGQTAAPAKTQAAPQGQQRQQQQQPPAQQQPPQEPAADLDEKATALNAMRHAVARNANLYNICIGAVANMVQPAYKAHTGMDMPEEHFQAAVASMYISAVRGDVGAQELPSTPLPLPKPRQPQQD